MGGCLAVYMAYLKHYVPTYGRPLMSNSLWCIFPKTFEIRIHSAKLLPTYINNCSLYIHLLSTNYLQIIGLLTNVFPAAHCCSHHKNYP